MLRTIERLSVFLFAVLIAVPLQAQTYPSKPIRNGDRLRGRRFHPTCSAG